MVRLILLVLPLALVCACSRRVQRDQADRTAVADTCATAAKTREACQRCCPAAGGWSFSPAAGCTCHVPARCPEGDRSLEACQRCCETRKVTGKVLVGPVHVGSRCGCQYL